MSWQVKDEITELNNLKSQIEKIRDQLFINNNQANLPSSTLIGGATGSGAPLGAGMWTGLHAFQPDNNITITDIALFTGIPTLFFNRIHITASSMVVKKNFFGSADIQWIEGALNDGQYIILKPTTGENFTLKTGGNIHLPADVLVNDTEFVICIFYENQKSPDNEGNWICHKIGTGGASGYDIIQDEGVSQTQRTVINFVGAGVVADDFGGKTRVTIPGASGSQTPWLQDVSAAGFFLFNVPRIEFNLAGTQFQQAEAGGLQWVLPSGNVYEWAIGNIDQMGLTSTELGLNVNLDMNLNFIKFQAIGIPPPPGGLEKRFLFCDSADFDKLKARSGTAIIDLEGLITNMGNLNNSAITVDLNFVFFSLATINFDGANVALSANTAGGTLPPRPVAFINIKVGGGNFKIPYYNA